MPSLVWLITGSSSGLALCLSRAALAAGHKVIATSRCPERYSDLVAEIEESGDRIWKQLDVVGAQLEQEVEQCIEKFGRLDVVVNNAGTEGFSTVPGLSMYAASKFALEGASEALSAELAGFGIRVLIVEPGGMRTNFLDSGSVHNAGLSEPYRGGAVDKVMQAIIATHGTQMQDPVRTAKRIVEAVAGAGQGWPRDREKFLRLPVGQGKC
ncbi:hypothetical protein LTR48_002576 [Friedmanniomyces endolithicus]|uniref:Uncharacterized protein n=1 Tax=Rachicladosporium monterosium TaxID=1507873 RepID=A0ABR0LAJ6_9PEZI|nr:hypothetical protein LTR48_002576 [Friedmanniomyces endolithicus]KAK5145981.1 hypothetical protein LTR32_002363 [Rachicladosporium monterosium]